MTSRRILAATTVALAAAGIALLAGALLVPASGADDETVKRAAPERTSQAGTTPTPATTAPSRSLSQLADPAWIDEMSGAAEIPRRALASYAGAAIAVSETHPGCNLGWNTLAAIGLVESEHGTIAGGAIGDDGATPPIIGVPLDGNGVAAIADTDGGLIDGDTEWDRAVGPMQFIPESWNLFGRDGNDDGEKDPHQIDDAALGAAVHLCDSAGDLGQPADWIAAVGAYNSSIDYNNRVADAAEHYASLG